MIDDLHLEFSSLARVQKALNRFITDDLGPEDQVALVTTSGANALSQEFTADRAVLRQTLSKLSLQNRFSGWTGVPYMSEYQAELIEAGDPFALEAAVLEIMNAGIFQDTESAEGQARQKARELLSEAVYASRLTLETLESLARGLAGVSGRKALFLVSDGFLTGLGTKSGAGYDLKRIADASTRAGVVIYSLDTRGLMASPPSATASSLTRTPPATVGLIDAMLRRSESATRDAMNALAADTGGFLVENSNDLRDGLKQMLKDSETYYVLAYEPTNTRRDGGFRKVEVKLPGVKGVKVRTRSGYLAPDDRRASGASGPSDGAARRAEQRQAEMRTALHSLAPLSAIPVRLSADFLGNEAGATHVVVSGHVGVEKLPFVKLRDRYQATIDAVALVPERGRRHGSDAPDRAERGGPERGRVPALPRARAPLPASDHAAAGALPGPAGRPRGLRGTARQRLAENRGPGARAGPPDAQQSLPAEGERREPGAGSRSPSRPAERPGAATLPPRRKPVRAGVRLQPQARRLRGGGPGFPGRDPARRRDARNRRARADRAGRARGPARAPHHADPLQRFEPGDYELRLTVTDKLAGAIATRRVPFSID